MKTIEEFEGFYNQSLLVDLQTLETERKTFIGKLLKVISIFAGVSMAGIAAFLFQTNMNAFGEHDYTKASSGNILLLIAGVSLITGVVVVIYRITSFSTKFTHQFKNEIIQKIVAFIDKGLSYSPQQFVSESEFIQSAIFTVTPDKYQGEDMVSGTLGATALRFSECFAQYKTTTTDSKGRVKTQWHTIFKGLFFVADFNKHFNTRTVVLPDTMEKMFGFLGKAFQSMNVSRDKLVKMEDPEFEKHFVVYGQDQVEARYILSPALMKRIVDFKLKTKSRVSLSFINSQVFIAIPVSKNLFEPKLFKTTLNYPLLKEYFDYLLLSTGIVEDLNLNTRIWTK